jgi:DNA-binding LacI/PurR family transcriptional regulator
MKDVARHAGVSIATVSRVLNNSTGVRPALRSRVLDAVRALNYQRDRAARSLRVRRSQIIGLIISDIQNPFFTSVVRGVEDVAYQNGYTLLLCNSDEDRVKENLYIETLLAERAAGVLISPVSETENLSGALLEAGIPVVAVDRRMNDLQVDTVVVDNIRGAYMGVSHLISLGCHHIGYVGLPTWTTPGRERKEGYQQALVEHGVTLQERLVKTEGFKQADGYHMASELLNMDRPPQALFAANNLTTLGALNAIHERGLSIPHDVAIVGFDDMPWGPALNPPLTAIAQPTYDLGYTAADLLLRRISERNGEITEVVLEPQLVVRASCGYVTGVCGSQDS